MEVGRLLRAFSKNFEEQVSNRKYFYKGATLVKEGMYPTLPSPFALLSPLTLTLATIHSFKLEPFIPESLNNALSSLLSHSTHLQNMFPTFCRERVSSPSLLRLQISHIQTPLPATSPSQWTCVMQGAPPGR